MDRADWAPSLADVGSILRARTVDEDGNELGTFTADTRPTDRQMDELIDTITSEIAAICGAIPDKVQDNARRTAAYGVAAEVELTYWPEASSSRSGSTYDRLYARYQWMLSQLKVQVSDINSGDDTNNLDLLPESSFPEVDPCDPNAFVGWSSRW